MADEETNPTKGGDSASIGASDDKTSTTGKTLRPGVILGKDGKPCRACNSMAAFSSQNKALKGVSARVPATPKDCPADVETLGRSTWTLLHSIAATYPEAPTTTEQNNLRTFFHTFSKLYPCWVCADDFQQYMKKETIRTSSRGDFGTWLCEAHNEVNRKLGKPVFDCFKWEERWRTGWRDGRCD